MIIVFLRFIGESWMHENSTLSLVHIIFSEFHGLLYQNSMSSTASLKSICTFFFKKYKFELILFFSFSFFVFPLMLPSFLNFLISWQILFNDGFFLISFYIIYCLCEQMLGNYEFRYLFFGYNFLSLRNNFVCWLFVFFSQYIFWIPVSNLHVLLNTSL